MKKGLLSILAASAVLVGCQNYDDQFDALNTQITQLKSTVDGLAGVQGEVTALKGLITSLQSEVSGVQSSLENDLADALAAIEEVEAAVADVASGEDLAEVQTSLDEVSGDVSDILESNNVYSQDVVVNSVGTLDFALALGSKLSIVNGDVVFIVNKDMDITKVQQALDQVGIVVGEFAYLAKTSTVSPVNFDNISSASDVEVAQAGAYSFASLETAANIYLGSNYSSKVTGVNLPELKTVTSLSTGSVTEGTGSGAENKVNPSTAGVNNEISFTKATSINMNKLTRYGSALTLRVDEGGSIGIDSLDDVDSTGAQSNIILTLEGPSAITITNIKDGEMTFKNVVTVEVNGFEGAFTLQAGVESFKADKVMSLDLTAATDLDTLEITGITDPDVSTDKEGPAISFSGNSNIRIVKLKGKIDDVDLDNNSSLEEAHVNAVVTDEITITNNSDLTAINLTDSSATGVKVENNNDLENVDIKTTTIKAAAAGSKVDGKYYIKDNPSLLSAKVSSKSIQVLEITGNDDMTSIDLTGANSLSGTTTGRIMKIFDNDLTATTATDGTDSTSDQGVAADDGSFAETAGMKTVKALADKMIADSKAQVYIYFDTVEEADPETGSNTNDHTFDSTEITNGVPDFDDQDVQLIVAHRAPSNAVTGKPEIAAKRAWLITGMTTHASNSKLRVQANAADLMNNDTNDVNLNSANDAVNRAAILDSANLADATAAGIILTAQEHANPKVSIKFSTNDSADENSSTATIVPSTFTSHTSDTYTLTMAGDKPAVISSAHGTVSDFVDALFAAWNTANSDADITQWDIATETSSTVITFTAKDKGTAQIGKILSFTAGVTSWTLSNVGYEIYNAYEGDPATATTNDNGAKGEGIVIRLESTTAGVSLGETGQIGSTAGTGLRQVTLTGGSDLTVTELTNTYRKNATLTTETDAFDAGTDEFPSQSRSDVRAAEDEIQGQDSNAKNFDRTHWLAD